MRGDFIAFGVEGVLYGINFVVFLLSVSVLLWNRNGKPFNSLMTLSTITLFTFCTVHYILEFENLYQGLMVKGFDVSSEDNVLRAADTLFSITDFLGQLILIYRCWLVWERNYLPIIIPSLMSLASLGCAMAGVAVASKIVGLTTTPPQSLIPLGDVAFALPLGINFLLTTLIAGRIWYIARGLKLWKTQSPIRIAIEVIIESGALIFAIQLVFVILFGIQSNAQNIAVSAALQIYGIAPTLIIVRVGMGRSIEATIVTKATDQKSYSNVPPMVFGGRPHSTDLEVATYELKSSSL